MNKRMFQPVEAFGRPFGMNENFAGAVKHRARNAQFVRGHINEGPETDALDPAGDDDSAR